MKAVIGYWLVGIGVSALFACGVAAFRSWLRVRRVLAQRRRPLVVLFGGKEDDRGLN